MLHFRCVKITQEERRIARFNTEPTVEQTISVQFECIEAQAESTHNPGSFHGYIGLTLPAKEFQELGYEIASIYTLLPGAVPPTSTE